MNIRSAIENTISISQFNRGLAGKIFDEVKRYGAKVVMKNNSPECVLLSPRYRAPPLPSPSLVLAEIHVYSV